MRPPGSFKLTNRTPPLGALMGRGALRSQRILDSLREQIVYGGTEGNLRVRQVFHTPREIYRLELELPELGYQRTTLLDRDALEELLETDDVREVFRTASIEV